MEDREGFEEKCAAVLHYWATVGRPATIYELVAAGCDVDSRDELGRTPFMTATRSRQWKAAHALLSLGADVNATMRDGETALYDAVMMDDLLTARFLLNNGANPNVRHSEFGGTPLHLAAHHVNLSMVTLLLEAGADPYAADNENRTAVDEALDDTDLFENLRYAVATAKAQHHDADQSTVRRPTPSKIPTPEREAIATTIRARMSNQSKESNLSSRKWQIGFATVDYSMSLNVTVFRIAIIVALMMLIYPPVTWLDPKGLAAEMRLPVFAPSSYAYLFTLPYDYKIDYARLMLQYVIVASIVFACSFKKRGR